MKNASFSFSLEFSVWRALRLLLCMLACSLAMTARAQTLVHRYSFTSDAGDSVGGADGTLVGDAYVTNGTVVLDGVVPTYVDLPNDLVINLTNYSFEVWLTWNGGAAWQRIFDFGNSSAGEDIQSGATVSACLTPDNGSVLGSYLYPTNSGFDNVNSSSPLTSGYLHQVVWAYDSPSTTSSLFVDGKLVNVNTNQDFSLPEMGSTLNDWIGHSQFFGDPDYSGTISEFRIYDGALSGAAVAANYTNGPDMAGWGTLQDIRLAAKSPMRAGAIQQIQVAADFQSASNLQFTLDPQVTYQVSDTNILSVTTNGVLTSLGSNSASASVSATYMGHTSSQAIQIIPYSTPVLIHRYSFTADATDSVGSADGTLGGDAVISNGVVVLDGSAYVQLPGDFCDSLTNVTFEFWLTWNGGGLWQHIFDFGNNDGGNGDGFGGAFHDINLVAKDGGAASDGGSLMSVIVINGAGVQSQVSAAPMSPSVYHHLVWTYDELSTTARLYLDGVQVGVGNDMVDTFNEFSDSPNCWLGQSQYGPNQDPDFTGSIDEFRIYDGTLSPAAITADYANGPNNSGPGNLLDIRVIGRTNMLIGSGIGQQLTVVADYQNVSGIDVTAVSQTTYHVSDPSVLAVTSGGVLSVLASAPTNATVTASFQGKSVDFAVSVFAPSPAILIHRYSFTSDASDSVGTADGTLEQDAVCSNGAVVLDGNAYVQLPPNFVTNLTNLTFEFWLTWHGGGQWQHIFDFGDNDGGPDGFGGAFHDFNLVARDGGAASDGGNHTAIILINGQGVQSVVSVPPITSGAEHQIVWTYDTPTSTSELYVDGVLGAYNLDVTNTFAGMADAPNCWLGQSQYGPGQDPDFNGSIDEFRIYTGTFTGQQVAFDYANGPNILASPISLGVSFTNGQVTISWPVDNSAGYGLESSAALGSGASWSAAGAPTATNGLNLFTIQPTNGPKFYRLKR